MSRLAASAVKRVWATKPPSRSPAHNTIAAPGVGAQEFACVRSTVCPARTDDRQPGRTGVSKKALKCRNPGSWPVRLMPASADAGHASWPALMIRQLNCDTHPPTSPRQADHDAGWATHACQ